MAVTLGNHFATNDADSRRMHRIPEIDFLRNQLEIAERECWRYERPEIQASQIKYWAGQIAHYQQRLATERGY
jgi:hypothetical protein